MDLEMSARFDGDLLVLELTGELRQTEIDEFKVWAMEQIREATEDVTVHCGNLTYIDSAGLGSFIYLRKMVMDQGRQFYLVSVGGWLKKFLEVTGLQEVLTTCNKGS